MASSEVDPELRANLDGIVEAINRLGAEATRAADPAEKVRCLGDAKRALAALKVIVDALPDVRFDRLEAHEASLAQIEGELRAAGHYSVGRKARLMSSAAM